MAWVFPQIPVTEIWPQMLADWDRQTQLNKISETDPDTELNREPVRQAQGGRTRMTANIGGNRRLSEF
jgi:hypothetical protein